ncbi:EF-hand domain-containing member C2 [Phlyctochytrium bullatum]|nr:EF-hand domain-containing member C2 [Phlyctochytrium bullatum]
MFNGKDLPNHRKSHAFDYCNTVPVFKEEASGIGQGGAPIAGKEEKKIHTSVDIYPHSDKLGENVPAWVAFDRKVLRFYAYFQEAVNEKREEQYRVRKIPKTDSPNGQHYVVTDLNVDKEVTFYSRTFKIVGCDDFTREFLGHLKIDVPKNSSFPSDPYEAYRSEMLARMKPTRPSQPKATLKKFLENDRRVLRFYCVWDDTNSVFGDVRHMNPDDYFSERDLTIGAVLHLYGRPFVICDCDEFTKEYYREKYGLENFDPVRIEDYDDEPIEEPPIPAASQTASSQPLIPSNVPPKKDFKKLVLYDGVCLRFSAVLKSLKQVDRDRKFVVSLYLADDTIAVFEPHQRNSGIIGGKFLEKQTIKKPGVEEYYGPQDFFIGAELTFYQHPFIITGADEYAIKFMDNHGNLFPKHRSAAS